MTHRIVTPVFYEREIRVVPRTPMQKVRDQDGTPHSFLTPFAVAPPVEVLYIGEPVSKGSLAANLPPANRPPQTDPSLTVFDYLTTASSKQQYQSAYGSTSNQAGYNTLSDQPRDPDTNRRLAQPPNIATVVEAAPRDPYALVKKSLRSLQEGLKKLRQK